MAKRKATKAEKTINGKRPYKYLERVECQAIQPMSDDDWKQVEASYKKRAKEKVADPVIREAWGAAIDVNDPNQFGIFGTMHLCNDEGPHDSDGFPLTTVRLFDGFWARLELMEANCRDILSKIGAEKWPHDLPYDATELQKDAHLFMRCMVAFCKRIKESDSDGAILWSFSLGSLMQRINVRWAEKYADAGRRKLLDAAKGRDKIKQRMEKRYRKIDRTVARFLKTSDGDLKKARSLARRELGMEKRQSYLFTRAMEWAENRRR